MSNHSIIKSHLNLFARLGRPQHSSTGAGQEPPKRRSTETWLPRLIKSGAVARFNWDRGLNCQLGCHRPSSSAISKVKAWSLSLSRPHGSNVVVGSQGPITLEFGAIEAANARS